MATPSGVVLPHWRRCFEVIPNPGGNVSLDVRPLGKILARLCVGTVNGDPRSLGAAILPGGNDEMSLFLF
jgi:hypothetical protein